MKNKGTRIAALFMAMLVMSTFAVAPAMACAPQAPQEPIDKSDEKKILKVVSEKISLPEEYSILRNPDTDGFVFTYESTPNSANLIDISKDHEIVEIWTATRLDIAGGHEVSLVSDEGNEISITIAGDLSSNDGEITIYDSSSSTVTRATYDCESQCLMTCGTLGGVACKAGCGAICTAVGVAYIPCVAVCLLWCVGVDTYVYCTEICDAIC